MATPDASIEIVRGWIQQAERIVVLTGAGISTDSGIPDFRGPKGLWTQNPEAENDSRSATGLPQNHAAVEHADRPIWWKSGNIE